MKTRGIIFTYSQVESLLEEGYLTDYQLLDDNGGDPYGNCVIVLESQFKENEIEELGLADELVDVWFSDNFKDRYAELDFEGQWYAKGCTNEAVFAEESDFELPEKTKTEFLDEIVSDVKSWLNCFEPSFTLMLPDGRECKIHYGFDESTTADNKMYENTLTNFEVWTSDNRFDIFELSNDEVIKYIESKIPGLYLINAVNQYSNWVWVDILFDNIENWPKNVIGHIVENARLSYDAEDFQKKVDEAYETALLEKWIVVDFGADFDEQCRYRVTRRSNFVEMDYCGAYQQYGKTLGCEAAGCYVFSNSESSIFLDFTKEMYEAIEGIEAIVDGNELIQKDVCEFLMDPLNYKSGIEFFGAENFKKMLEFFKEFEAVRTSHTKAKGWTYHDGSNFRTVVVETDFEGTDTVDCTELDEDEQLEILKQMPQSAPYMEGFYQSEETDDFTFHFNREAADPWFCTVTRK